MLSFYLNNLNLINFFIVKYKINYKIQNTLKLIKDNKFIVVSSDLFQ